MVRRDLTTCATMTFFVFIFITFDIGRLLCLFSFLYIWRPLSMYTLCFPVLVHHSRSPTNSGAEIAHPHNALQRYGAIACAISPNLHCDRLHL